MAILSDIEELCREQGYQDIPALKQLRLANKKNDAKTIKRITENIISFLNEIKKEN